MRSFTSLLISTAAISSVNSQDLFAFEKSFLEQESNYCGHCHDALTVVNKALDTDGAK